MGRVSDALIKHYPASTELEGDYWVVMAERFSYAHEVWKNDLARVERTIEYGMPLECVKLSQVEFVAEFREAIKRVGNRVSERRDARIEADALAGGYAEVE